MDLQRIHQHKAYFDAISQTIKSDDGREEVEVWFARDLQKVLGYARWENFQVAIVRAIESCKGQNVNVGDHFREVTKMVAILLLLRFSRTVIRLLLQNLHTFIKLIN